MRIRVFENTGTGFAEETAGAGLANTSSWWTSLAAGDFDSDGDTDYVVGNLGLNTRYETSLERPVRIHGKDYDQNGQIAPVITHAVGGTRYPVPRRDEMIEQIPGLKSRFPTYSEYAEASFAEVFTEREREGTYVRGAERFETSYVENEGGETFSVRALPLPVQIAPVFGMETGDYDADGHLDLLMVGNWYAPNVRTGRADAFTGVFLEGDGTGHFSPEDGTESGFFVDEDGKGLAQVSTGERPLLVATQNAGPLDIFQPKRSDVTDTIPIRSLDQSAELHFEDGGTRQIEFYYGSGYLSQSSRGLRIPAEEESVVITNSTGNQRTVELGKGSQVETEK